MTDEAISPLRRRMIEDMTMRKFVARGLESPRRWRAFWSRTDIGRARELLAIPILPIEALKAAGTNTAEPQTPEHPCPCCREPHDHYSRSSRAAARHNTDRQHRSRRSGSTPHECTRPPSFLWPPPHVANDHLRPPSHSSGRTARTRRSSSTTQLRQAPRPRLIRKPPRRTAVRHRTPLKSP
jgi:hypothetical protein